MRTKPFRIQMNCTLRLKLLFCFTSLSHIEHKQRWRHSWLHMELLPSATTLLSHSAFLFLRVEGQPSPLGLGGVGSMVCPSINIPLPGLNLQTHHFPWRMAPFCCCIRGFYATFLFVIKTLISYNWMFLLFKNILTFGSLLVSIRTSDNTQLPKASFIQKSWIKKH